MNGWAAGRTDPSNPFNSLSPDETTSQLELSRNLGTPRVFNYAVARVRYLGPNTVDANNVSVFFRVFNTVVSALEYDHTSGTTGNYRRSGNVSGSVPLLGIQNGEIASIPFFAEARVDTSAASMTGQHDLTNTQTLTGIGTEQVAYFGCWLDINLASTDPLALQFPLNPAADPNGPNGPYTTPRQTIQTLIRGPHQCMVAEVFFWPTGTVGDPIPTGASPSSSDRLAQRNLAIDESGNPGWPVTHTVQHTFMVKPSAGIVKPIGFRDGTFSAVGAAEFGPDELMIRWTNVPRDSRATLYFPEVDADEILALNTLRQHPAALQKVDTHTLQCSIADVSYVPLPGGRSGYLAGLMTLTLPDGIRAGKVFKLNVQQYSGVTRRILGAFQLTVPVKNEPEILPNETRKLSVMRYIQQSIPAGNRWALIFQRYVQQIADRVDAMGGDSTQVAPSPSGNGGMQAAGCKLWARVTGTLLAGLVLALGTLTGCALTVVPPILAVLLVIVALVWINKCHPRQCWKLRTFISGAGLGAALLAILALAGIGAPQLVPVLCVVVILLAIAFLIGVIQKCF
jgi:hypothetical protein